MKKVFCILTPIVLLLASGCQRNDPNDQVVSKRYIHKYGYEMTEKEWKAKIHPGQVITTLRNGVTIAASYEDGLLSGPCTHTYPHSQTVQTYYLYNNGNLVKEINYDIRGLPMREDLYIAPNRIATTEWFADGCPRATEEYQERLLYEGEYFNPANETEAQVIHGEGTRIVRSLDGDLLRKEDFSAGKLCKRWDYHPNGAPETIADYANNQLHGVRLTYAPTGEPLAIEEWEEGKLHGKATYFHNGAKASEICYFHGMKDGTETRYLDGEVVVEEIEWIDDIRHGPSHFYVNNTTHTQWFYEGKEVTAAKYEEMVTLDQLLSQAPEFENSEDFSN